MKINSADQLQILYYIYVKNELKENTFFSLIVL